MQSTSRALLAGLGAGATLTYFLDRANGGRRRARLRDIAVHTSHKARHATATAARDGMQRMSGTVASLRHLAERGGVDDEVVVERVRAKLGRLVSHPHAIRVAASNGSVTLKGAVLAGEAKRLVRGVRRVRGVREVIDRLERHAQPGRVSALQGGHAPTNSRLDVLQDRWAPATRCAAATAATALVALGLRRRGPQGVPALAAGAALFARAGANRPFRQLLGAAPAERVGVQKTITVHAPVDKVYAFWSAPENFPRFTSRVLEVRPHPSDKTRTHWKVVGPAGVPIEFDAVLGRSVRNQLIEWHTTGHSSLVHAGAIHFDAEGRDATRVHMQMSYAPPGGRIGHQLARIAGMDPKSVMDADLLRMKTLIETGHAPRDAARRRRAS